MSSRLALRLVVVGLTLFAPACSNSESTSPTPTVPTSATRVIGLSGNLAFGNVPVGLKATVTLTITNSGTAALTVTGMTVPAGSVYSSSFTAGTIAAGGSQSAIIQFAPSAGSTYNGSLTVNGDQTSGTNSISISGTGIAATPTPPPTSTTFSLSGVLTDGTSHGILPNITVQIVSGTNAGISAVTDSTGNYAMNGLLAGTFTLSLSATSYQTLTQQVTLSANTRVDLVLQRVAPTPPPTPTPTPTPAPAPAPTRTRVGATCNDGTSSSATGSGACSSHGGVRCWRYTDGTCTNP